MTFILVLRSSISSRAKTNIGSFTYVIYINHYNISITVSSFVFPFSYSAYKVFEEE